MPLANWENDISEIISDIGSEVTIAGKVYDAVVAAPVRSREQDVPGFMPDDEFSVLIKNSDFKTLPDLGGTVTYGGRVYRINRIADAQEGVCKVLWCNEDDS